MLKSVLSVEKNFSRVHPFWVNKLFTADNINFNGIRSAMHEVEGGCILSEIVYFTRGYIIKAISYRQVVHKLRVLKQYLSEDSFIISIFIALRA